MQFYCSMRVPARTHTHTHTHTNFDLKISIRNLKLAYRDPLEMNKLQTYRDHVSTRPL
jgi:hypothetical protein